MPQVVVPRAIIDRINRIDRSSGGPLSASLSSLFTVVDVDFTLQPRGTMLTEGVQVG